jgi:ABC transporter substrate binding protein (PQQ-dependent alcohol dehydrogenase system)
MISRRLTASLVAAFLASAALLAGLPTRGASAQDEVRTLTIGYLQIADDPRYEQHRAYTGLRLRDRKRPVDGAVAAIRESRVIGRALKIKFELETEEVADADEMAAAILRLKDARNARFFVLDAPAEALQSVAALLGGEGLLLFNVTDPSDSLRGRKCARVLMHTFPSRAMLMDGLAQYLRTKGWDEALVLKGPLPEDAALTDAFARSAKKFGVRIVAAKDFVPGHDPRQRDQNNITLLTARPDHDVVFLADSDREFGRYVPYQTSKPRPVVGTEGLIASAWHWTWERYGAPQLNQRFDRHAKRTMQDADWAAWAAVKAVVEAVVRTGSTDAATVVDYLRGGDFGLDVYKGAPASFRAWNNQLRQPILLHTHNAAVARAPFPEFLHPVENMDTLGVDAPESACKF